MTNPDPAALHKLIDQRDIEELHSRYLFALDWLDADTVASLFAEDGVLDWAGGVVEGREAIRAEVGKMRGYFGGLAAADAPNRPARLRHFVTNSVLRIDGDRARSTAFWFEINNDNHPRWPYVGAYGHYEDEIARTAEGWRFLRRTIFNELMPERSATAVNPAEAL